VIAHDVIEDALRRIARFVRTGCLGHAPHTRAACQAAP
jgi:hypothetical protein